MPGQLKEWQLQKAVRQSPENALGEYNCIADEMLSLDVLLEQYRLMDFEPGQLCPEICAISACAVFHSDHKNGP